MTENPNSQGLELIAGDVGVLILHEAATSPDLASTWALRLHSAGVSVNVPELSQSPATWQETRADDLREWLTIAEQSLAMLKNRCSTVFIVGVSMASTIALRLAELLGDEINGMIIIEPSLPKNRFALRKMWRTIEEELYLVEQPLMILYSIQEASEYSDNVMAITKSVTSPFVRELIIENSFGDIPIIIEECSAFIDEVAHGFWLTDIENNDDELINAEFESMVAGLSLDESHPTNFLDDLDRPDPEDHFQAPNPALEPIHDRSKRNALYAMLLGPIYAVFAAISGFNPFGIEPWPGVLLFIGGLASFLYHLRDGFDDDDGAIL